MPRAKWTATAASGANRPIGGPPGPRKRPWTAVRLAYGRALEIEIRKRTQDCTDRCSRHSGFSEAQAVRGA
eukprot:353770-Rhodomonas_salina.2